MDRLTLAYAQRVWGPLSDDNFRKDLERSLAKLCYVRGMNRDSFHDFNHTLYEYCAKRAGEFDDTRASLKTWMILQARRLIIDIVRDHGWASRVFGWDDVTESDLVLKRTEDYNEKIGLTLDMLAVTDETPEDELIEQENEIARRVINREVRTYAEMLDDKEKACLDLLLATGFEISDTEMAKALGFGGHSTAGKLRKRLYGELGLRLLHFGISLENTHV